MPQSYAILFIIGGKIIEIIRNNNPISNTEVIFCLQPVCFLRITPPCSLKIKLERTVPFRIVPSNFIHKLLSKLKQLFKIQLIA
jgi:hypothetical protein